MEKKYRTEKDPRTGFLRIIALKNFSNVKAGEKGGLIETECNLSQEGNCWVYRNAKVYGHARVYENAKVYGYACVYEHAWIYEDAIVRGGARVSDNAMVYGNAKIYGSWIEIYGNAEICGNTKIWATTRSCISDSIKNNKDCIMLVAYNRKWLRVFSSNTKVTKYNSGLFTVAALDYLKNIQIIRQIYEEEI